MRYSVLIGFVLSVGLALGSFGPGSHYDEEVPGDGPLPNPIGVTFQRFNDSTCPGGFERGYSMPASLDTYKQCISWPDLGRWWAIGAKWENKEDAGKCTFTMFAYRDCVGVKLRQMAVMNRTWVPDQNGTGEIECLTGFRRPNGKKDRKAKSMEIRCQAPETSTEQI